MCRNTWEYVKIGKWRTKDSHSTKCFKACLSASCPRFIPPCLHSLSALLPRTHADNHQQHASVSAARGDPKPDGKRFGRTDGTRWRAHVNLPAWVSGAVHEGDAHPLSAAHGGDSVAGLHSLPHQKEVSAHCYQGTISILVCPNWNLQENTQIDITLSALFLPQSVSEQQDPRGGFRLCFADLSGDLFLHWLLPVPWHKAWVQLLS